MDLDTLRAALQISRTVAQQFGPLSATGARAVGDKLAALIREIERRTPERHEP